MIPLQTLRSTPRNHQSIDLRFRRIPVPSYRHAAPSGPWPWVDECDLADALDELNELERDGSTPAEPIPLAPCDHKDCNDCPNWNKYPQSLFGNWTPKPVAKCKIAEIVRYQSSTCVIRYVNVKDSGLFEGHGKYTVSPRNVREHWRNVVNTKQPAGLRVQVLFVENMSGPALQMLGTRFIIEPFFFSSSLNWIPSRYQENVQPKQGDHISITLTFLRAIGSNKPLTSRNASTLTAGSMNSGVRARVASQVNSLTHIGNDFAHDHTIDTRAPLTLSTGDKSTLLLDLLAIHMVRGAENTIITYHPKKEWHTITSKDLHTRARLVGKSVYWRNIFAKTVDPTFVLLAILWYALYAWDEALEKLYVHFCWLESSAIITNDMLITQQLHVIRAHLLQYASLLEDFKKSVVFVRDTHNPAMDADDITSEMRKQCRVLLNEECANLLSEIERLELSRALQDARLTNVTQLVFASVNIGDSKAMKRLSYVTLVFLPGTFVAGIFGMNVKEINPGTLCTTAQYVITALSLTFATFWIMAAFHSAFYLSNDPDANMWKRLLWPIALFLSLFRRRKMRTEEQIGPLSGLP